MGQAFSEAGGIPAEDPTPVATFAPLVLPAPDRTLDLELKVSAPARGEELPVLLFSHGHGPSNFVSSLRGYGPLVDFWAARGFVVIQPTHLDSTVLGLREADDPDAPLYWRSRALDMHLILDGLDRIEATVPGLAGRLDRERIAAVGHSMGGHTVGMLCGQGVEDLADGRRVDLADARVRVGVLMAPPGRGEDLAAFASEHYPALGSTSFEQMATPALVVFGDKDQNPRFSERLDWRRDAYDLSPSPKSLLTLFGAEHGLGGISMYDGAETTDENPERVAALRALVWAYLSSTLYPGDTAWSEATSALEAMSEPVGRTDSK